MVKVLNITNDLSQLSLFETFLKEVSYLLGLNDKTCMDLHLALEEVIVNTILYAYPGEKNKDITLKVKYDVGKLIFTLLDEGIPFDPTGKADPDTTSCLEDRQVGGLGIFLAKKLMSEIYYKRTGKKNVLTMIKELP